MQKQKNNDNSKTWVEMVNPDGTSVKTYRIVELSSRKGKYIKYCGHYFKLPSSGLMKVKLSANKDRLP